MKNKLRKWLGINDLESLVGKPEKEKSTWSSKILFGFYDWEPVDNSLSAKYTRLRKDFEELDKKFDDLEKYLQIEYFKTDESVQVYEWENTEKRQGFRKTKPYEVIKKEKEVKDSDE